MYIVYVHSSTILLMNVFFYVYYCGLLTRARVKIIFFKDLNCNKQNH